MLAGLVGGRKGGAVPRQKQRPKSFLEGYLNKRNTKTSKFAKQWNKRWFELAGDTLTYAKSAKDLTSGDICVFAVHECEMLEVARDRRTFELRFPERDLCLQAADAAEAEAWVTALQDSYKASSGGRAISSSPVSALRPGRMFHSAVSSDEEDAGTTGGLSRGGSGMLRTASSKQMLPPPDALDAELEGAAAKPPSPRSLLAKPAAFGKFRGDGNMFRAGSGGQRAEEPPAAAADSEVLTFDEPDVVQTFEPVPPTPPQGTLRSRHVAPRSGQRQPSPPAEAKPPPPLAGARDLGDDEHGIATIRLATPAQGSPRPPAAAIVVGEDEDWLNDDWDDDSPKKRPSPAAKSKKAKQAFRPNSRAGRAAAAAEAAARPAATTALEDYEPTPPQSPGPSPTAARAPPQQGTPGVKADDDWLEEDWDSDDE